MTYQPGFSLLRYSGDVFSPGNRCELHKRSLRAPMTAQDHQQPGFRHCEVLRIGTPDNPEAYVVVPVVRVVVVAIG